jgi:O-6-methylguanine DNA methyltransferase
MMVNELDAVTAALGALRHAGSPGLEQRVFAGWLRAPSRLGEVFVAATRDGVQFVRSAESVDGDPGAFAEAYRRRFARPLRPVDRGPAGLLPALHGRRGAAARLDLSSLTAFERDVLAVTRSIPAGETRPYGWVAREAGHPTAVRAVASVLARNPVPLLVPCHRVVRSDGSLGGYMFGPAHKNELLQGEGANLDVVADLARQGVHYLGSDTTGVVCFPTCHHARRITPAHRSGFATIGDAVAAGYRSCRSCRPAAAA